jgi:autotransporter-associated beta strand protein
MISRTSLTKLLLGCILAAPQFVAAQTNVVWGTDTEFYTWSQNGWRGGGTPTSSDVAEFASSNYEYISPTVDANFTVAGIQIDSGASYLNIGGSGTLTVNDSIIDNTSSNVTISAPLSLGSSFTFNGSGSGNRLIISGDLTGSNGYTVQSGLNLEIKGTQEVTGTLFVYDTSNLKFDFSGDSFSVLSNPITNDASVTFGCNGGPGIIYTGAMMGWGSVKIDEPVTFSANNSYSGTTTITSYGTLSDSVTNAFSPSSDLYLDMGATLNVKYPETIGNLDDASCGSTINLINGSAILTVTSSGTDTFNGTMSGYGGLTVNGYEGSSLILLGSNTYLGGTTINPSVTLQLGNGGTSGSIMGGVTDNGTLVFDRSDCISFPGQITGTGAVTISDGMVTLSNGDNNYYGATTVSGSAKLEDGASLSFSQYSLIDLENCAKLEVNYGEKINGLTDDGNGSSTVCIGSGATLITTDGSGYAYSGTITGDGSFEVGPSAFEILTGTNNYWGVTTIDPGAKLQLGNGGTSGSITNSEFVVDNGALVFDHSNCVTLDSPIQGSGTVTVAGGMATLLGTNTYSGGTTIDGGTTLQLGNGDSTGSIVGAVSNSGTLTFDNPGCTTFGGSISGNGAVNINDGMVTFSGGFGSNTYLGDTTIASSSKLEDGAAYSFSPNSAIYLDGTSRLGVNFNETINGLNDDGGGSSTVCIANNTTLLTNGYGYTYGGTIMGAGSIEFGAGATEILTGTNTYTGGTTIDASGTLQLGNAGSTGTISDTSAVANNGTLDFDVAGAVTFGAPISGTGSVEVMAGTLTLTGSNTYSGGTTIDSISTLQLGNGGTSGSITGNVANSGTLAFDRTDTVTFAGAISGTGSVSVSTGTVTLSGANSYSGPTTVYAGVLQAGSTSAFGSASTVTVDSTLNLNGFSNSIGSLQGGGSVNLGSATLTLLSAATDFTGVISGTGGVNSSSSSATFTGANTYSGGTTIASGLLIALNTSGSAVGSGPITIDSGATLQVGNLATSGGIGPGNIANNGVLTLDPAAAATYPNAISGTGSITINGGPTTFSGANTYSGGTTVNSVTLADTVGSASFSPNSSITLTSGAQLDVNHNETINGLIGDSTTTVDLGSGASLVTAADPMVFSGDMTGAGSFDVGAGATEILTGTNNYTGGTTIAGTGILQLGNATASGSITGNVADDGTLAFDRTDSITFPGVISGTGGIDVMSGTVTLSGANSYSGSTSVSGASTSLADSSAGSFSPMSAVSLSSGAHLGVTANETVHGLSDDGTSTVGIASQATLTTTGISYTYGGAISGAGSFAIASGASEILTGNSLYSGGTTIGSSGALQLGMGGTSGSIAGSVANGGVLTFDRSDSISFAGAISGTGAVNIEDGTVTLSGANTYSGATTVTDATLADSAAGAFSVNSLISLFDDAALSVTANETIKGLNGDSTTSVGIESGATLLTTGVGSSYAGAISGAGSLALGSGASETLTGSNSYLGGTTIGSSAVLKLGNDGTSGSITGSVTDNGALTFARTDSVTFPGSISGTGDVSVAYGTVTFGGANTYSGGTTVAASSTLQVGNGGTLGSISGNVIDNGTLILDRTDSVTFAGAISGTGALSIPGGTLTLSGANTYSGATTVNSATLEDGAAGAFSSSSLFSLIGATLDVTANESVNGINADSASTISIGNGATLLTTGTGATILGTVSGAGAFAVGPGASEVLSGSDTYSGGTAIGAAGTLQLGGGGTTGSITGNVANSGTLLFDRSDSVSFPGIISGTGGVTVSDGTVALLGANSYTGGTSIGNAATLQLGNGGTSGSIAGAVANHGTLAFDTSGSTVFSGGVSGPGGVSVMDGTVTLSGTNSYSGGTVLSNGTTLDVTNSNSLGSGQLTTHSGVGSPTVLAASGGPVALSNTVVVAGSGLTLNFPGSPLLTLNGLIKDFGSFDSLIINGPVDLEGANTYSGGTTVNSASVTIGTNSGLGTGSVQASASTLAFTGSAPALASPSFTNGTVASFSGNPVLTNLSLAQSTLNFNGASATLASMATDGSGSGNAINLASGTQLKFTVTPGNETDYYGTISDGDTGTGAVVVDGGGTLDLRGSNTYGGGTTVDAGLLAATSSTALGTGPLSVASGAKFGMDTGVTVSNAVDLAPGAAIGGYGTFAPGTAQDFTISGGSTIVGGRGTFATTAASKPVIGTLTFSANATLVFAPGGVMQFSIMNATGTPGTDYSEISAAGALDITATAANPFEIQLVGVDSTGLVTGTASTFNPSQSYSWTLLSAGSITMTGGFNSAAFTFDTSNFSNSLAGGFFSVTDPGSGPNLMLNFTPVPEPSTWALMATGLGALVAAVRRRRR